MSSYTDLDVDSVARIGLMYVDGDQFEEVLLDKHGHTDYDFARFILVKHSLTHMEQINPALRLDAILWQRHPANEHIVRPLVAGRSLPLEGWMVSKINSEMNETYTTGVQQVKQRSPKRISHYYPVRNSDDEIVGVLELLQGMDEIEDM